MTLTKVSSGSFHGSGRAGNEEHERHWLQNTDAGMKEKQVIAQAIREFFERVEKE